MEHKSSFIAVASVVSLGSYEAIRLKEFWSSWSDILPEVAMGESYWTAMDKAKAMAEVRRKDVVRKGCGKRENAGCTKCSYAMRKQAVTHTCHTNPEDTERAVCVKQDHVDPDGKNDRVSQWQWLSDREGEQSSRRSHNKKRLKHNKKDECACVLGTSLRTRVGSDENIWKLQCSKVALQYVGGTIIVTCLRRSSYTLCQPSRHTKHQTGGSKDTTQIVML